MTFSNPSSAHERLTQTVSQALATTAAPGAAVALVLDGRPVFASSVGFRDHEQTTALDTDAQFYIYSVTKTLLATVILQLVEHEQIALEALLDQGAVRRPGRGLFAEPEHCTELCQRSSGRLAAKLV